MAQEQESRNAIYPEARQEKKYINLVEESKFGYD